MIGQRYNFEDSFFRDLTVSVLDTLEGEIKWVNKFSSGDRVVNVPFYYSLTGDERFLLDSFNDDIVSDSRKVDLNTDIIPRGHLTLTGYDIRSDEFANPNVWLRMVVEHNDEIRKVLTKIRAIPITAKYSLSILLTSEIDTFKCSQAIMDTIWLYRFMYFEHNFLNIDAVMIIPDTSEIQIQREKGLSSDNTIKLTLSFDVQTYYPAYRKPKLPKTISYPIQTTFVNKLVSVKIQVSQGNVSNIIFTEYHNAVTSSDGSLHLMIGSGTKFDFNSQNLDEPGTEFLVYPKLPNFKYSNRILDEFGVPLVSTTVTLRVQILRNSETGQSLYSETYSLDTDSNGYVKIEIGLGDVVAGNLMKIDWKNGIYFLKFEVDINGGYDFVVVENKLFTGEFTGEQMLDEFNVPSNPEIALNQGSAVKVFAILLPISGSNNKSFQCVWPILPPSGIDRLTNTNYQYGVGSLEDINSGDLMNNLISDNFSSEYAATLRDVNDSIIEANLGSIIPKSDGRNWYVEYEAGILNQLNVNNSTSLPETLEVYYKLGKKKENKSMSTGGKTGDLFDLYKSRNGLRISIGIDPEGGENYEIIINNQSFDVKEFNPDPNSNSFDFGTQGGDFQDTILYPKKTRWYNDNKGSKAISIMTSMPKSDNNVNLGKNNFKGKFFK